MSPPFSLQRGQPKGSYAYSSIIGTELGVYNKNIPLLFNL